MRNLSRLVPIVMVCSFLAVFAFSPAAFAVPTYELEATPQDPEGQYWSPFTVIWTDSVNADGKLQLEELDNFFGVTYSDPITFISLDFDQITAVPEYSDSSPFTAGPEGEASWSFENSMGDSQTALPSNWSYEKRSVVPLPASALLLGSGLLGLGFLGWRRKRS